MDKVAAALISAPIGAIFGFLGAALMEFMKRRLAHLDKMIDTADELAAELSDVGEKLERGRRPDQGEIRALLKLRRKLGINLERLFIRALSWPQVKDALQAIDHCIEKLDESALGEGDLAPANIEAEAAGRRLDGAVRAAAREDLIWRHLRAR